MDLQPYRVIADLFDFPAEDFPQKVRAVGEYLNHRYPEASVLVERFLGYLPVEDVHAMQELYTRTFDVQAITTLDLGYVLFGDDYKRGEMLSHLNKEHAKYGNPCRNELSDHLPNVLRLLPMLEDEDLRNEMASVVIYPALVRMISEFNPERIEKKKKSYQKHYKTLIDVSENGETAYVLTLQALDVLLQRDFELQEVEPPATSSDFLRNVTSEMTIEETAKA
ncbi:MAG: hypothetical protein H6624_03890 [Bdellovibrionaceae bacterium]|nr:hypothetical protein [Bdellovibrionales bacterium]MCB9083455.1 hypothetical protein [Pseudobdellovibrionaceae bacterium]